VQAAILRIADCPLVFPCPIIAINTVPGGCKVTLDCEKPSSLIFSSVSWMKQFATSPLLTYGIEPPQYSFR
jgi:hypothetical protein